MDLTGSMDAQILDQIRINGAIYKATLERLHERFSKLTDIGVEVDLHNMKIKELKRYMSSSKMELSNLESKTSTSLSEESVRAQEITRDIELDFSHQDSGANESLKAMDNYGVSGNNTLVMMGSHNQNQTYLLDPELQPEDQDEELEKSLLSQGSSLLELYPSTVNKIGKTWHRWHLAETANSVIRRYRKLRCLSNKSTSKHTLDHPWRQTNSESKKISPRATFKRSSNSSINANCLQKSQKKSTATPVSPLRSTTNLHDSQADKQCSERKIHTIKTEGSYPAQVMPCYRSSGLSQNCSELQDMILNQTFEVSQMSPKSCSSWKREPVSDPNASPMRLCFPKTDAFMEMSLGCERLTHSTHTPKKSGYGTETSPMKCPTILYSPVWQGVFKNRWMTAEGSEGSALDLSRNPRPNFVTSNPSGPFKPRALIESPGFSIQKAVMSPKKPYIQDASHLSKSKVHSPRSSSMDGVHSPFQVSSFSRSPIKLEDEFQKHYHKLVCQGNSSLSGSLPCQLCIGSFTVRRGYSSALAALALSPHHSRLRKRYRDLDWDKSNSKRSRQEHCPYSPGSLRYKREMQRIQHHSSSSLLSPTAKEISRRSLASIRSQAATAQAFSPQRPSKTSDERRQMVLRGKYLPTSPAWVCSPRRRLL